MPLELTILTPYGRAYTGTVERVVLPGAEGEVGVLEHHEKLMLTLREGVLELLLGNDQVERLAVSEGFAEIRQQSVLVLVDECRAGEAAPHPGPAREG